MPLLNLFASGSSYIDRFQLSKKAESIFRFHLPYSNITQTLLQPNWLLCTSDSGPRVIYWKREKGFRFIIMKYILKKYKRLCRVASGYQLSWIEVFSLVNPQYAHCCSTQPVCPSPYHTRQWISISRSQYRGASVEGLHPDTRLPEVEG